MSTAVTWNGTTYYVPAVKETRTWGASLSSYLIAISTGALQKSGGSFILTADANFGSNYGLVAKYFKSVSSNIGASEIIRLANAEGIAWRNAANSADIALKVNASDRLQLDGVDIPTVGSTDTFTGVKTFADGSLKLAGATSGAATVKSPAAASTYTYTLPVPTAGMTETLIGQATTETLTNKTLTSPKINTQATIKAAGEVRFNNASDTFYVGFKGGNAGANKIWELPTADGSTGQVLQTDGSATLGWASVATDATTQYAVKVGDSGGTAQQTKTNLIGRFQAEYASAAITVTIATPGVVSHTGHGRSTGDRVYFTTTGALPTGLTAATSYYITKVDANSYKLSTSLANLLAGTFVATSGTQSGTHTGYCGGIGTTENYQGVVSGTVVPVGYIGETVETASAITTTSATTTEADVTNANLSLSPGKWRIEYSVSASVTTGASATNSTYILVVITDNANTHITRTERILQLTTPAAAAAFTESTLSAYAYVTPTATTTYKLRLKRTDVTGTGSASVAASSVEGNIFSAVRVA